MKKIISLILSFIFLTGVVFAEDPAIGLWKSIDDKTGEITAIWNIYEKDGKLFGEIAAVVNFPQNVIASTCKESYKDFPKSGAVNKMTTVGTPWIYNMVKESEGHWKDGNIVNPEDGKMYGCVIIYLNEGDKNKNFKAKEPTLAMAGTVGPIKVFQYWIKATEADVKSIQEKFPAE